MAKTDRDSNYMREAFGTTSLVTDYVDTEVKLSPRAESLLRVARQSYSSGPAVIVAELLRELAKNGNFTITVEAVVSPAVFLPLDPLLEIAQELDSQRSV
jgi:hypothetical protein